MKHHLAHAVLFEAADPFTSAYDMAHHAAKAQHRTKQARNLLNADEALNMPDDRQILYISGIGCPPIYAHKYPYFTRREMAGHYLPNPYHPPHTKVRIKSRIGSKWADVITEPVPDRFAHLPQYQGGTWSYVKGYRP